MNCIKIELNSEEEKIFEFRLYQFQGLQIAMNQFLTSREFKYNEEHYAILSESFIEKYRLLTEYIICLLEKRQYKDIAVNSFGYEYTKGLLKLQFQQNG